MVTQKGFTLIEMLIVVAIVAVMATVLLFNYSSFSTGVGVRNLASQIGLSVRKAQTYATSVRSISGTNGSLSDTYPAYGISFSVASGGGTAYSVNSTNFVLFADVSPLGNSVTDNLYGNDGVCGKPTGGDHQECVESFGLTGGNTIISLCTDSPSNNSCFTAANPGTVNVVFHRPDPDAFICVVSAQGTCLAKRASYLNVTVQSPKGLQRVITIWNTGQISIN